MCRAAREEMSGGKLEEWLVLKLKDNDKIQFFELNDNRIIEEVTEFV